MRRLMWAFVGLQLLVLLAVAWGFLVEPRLLTVNRIEIASSQWPAAAGPLRLAVVGDLQVGSPHVGLDKLAEVVRRVNALAPDVVLLPGDFVGGRLPGGDVVPAAELTRQLARLEAPLGVYAVLGNHDWYHGGAQVRRALTAAGIVVLENRAVPVPAEAPRFWLAGLADAMERDPRPVETVAAVPEGMPVLAMAHEPDTFEAMPARVALTVAGHTHGGQVYLPWIGALFVPGPTPRRLAYGHVREDGRDLYVTAGVGTSRLPFRLNMPPEIALITLRPGG